ncbi:MAG: amidohydrolase [bacterium]
MKKLIKLTATSLLAFASLTASAFAQATPDWTKEIETDHPYILTLYKQFHRNPELSFMEVETAKRMADEFRAIGFDVTEHVGKTGVVGVLRNGPGPTIMLRADMDALPVEEKTGLPYASTIRGNNYQGKEFPVMHACGHDIHMSSLVGAARQLANHQSEWSGTLVVIAQPAEELGLGAIAMLDDGLYEKFPRPDYNIALHDTPNLPAGTVGYSSGWALANVDSVDIYVKGVGGHGSVPENAKDPVVLGSQIVIALQTLVSREIAPQDPAVVTVGAFNAGFKHNIISDKAHLQITVRSYSDEVRNKLLAGIKRIAKAQAISAGLPEDLYPVVEVGDPYTPSTYNDPELSDRIGDALRAKLGAERVFITPAVMGGEDFSRYGREEPKIPSMIFWLGAMSPEKLAKAKEEGQDVPSLHSPFFAPEPSPTLKTGVEALTTAALELFNNN